MTLILLLVIALIAAALLVFVYNKFAHNKNQVLDAWHNIDIFLKQRHELVPNLVKIVKGYAQHESETLEQITLTRSIAAGLGENDISERIQAEQNLKKSLNKIFVAIEGYPDLKADNNFMALQTKLSELEETLSRSRRYYNATVRENNIFGESIPGVWFVGMFPFQHFDYYEAEDGDKSVVDVDLS